MRIKSPKVKEGQLIKITEKKCKDSLQPLAQVNNVYLVLSCEDLGDKLRLRLKHPTNKKKSFISINSDRFSWEEYSISKAVAEKFVNETVQSVMEVKKQFSFREHMRITFYPRILEYAAWEYVDKAIKSCAEYRMTEFKKWSRTLRELKRSYDTELRMDLKPAILLKIEKQAKAWLESCALYFFQMRFAVDNAFSRDYKQYPEFWIYVYIARLLLQCKRKNDEIQTKELEKRLGTASPSYELRHIKALYTMLDAAFTDDFKEFVDKNMEIARNVLWNYLEKIEWGD